MKLYAHINGDNFTMLNEKDANNRLLKEPSAIMQEVERADNSMSGGANGYKLVDGFVIAKTQGEIDLELDAYHKAKAKDEANKLYTQLEDQFLIMANGRTYNFDISKKIDFFAKYIMQTDEAVLDWDDYSNETVSHSKAQAYAIIQTAEVFLRGLFAAKKSDKLAIEGGDLSLAKLNAIKADQDLLRRQG